MLWAYSIGAGAAVLSAAGVAMGLLLKRSSWGPDASLVRYLHEKLACDNPLIVGAKFIVYLGLPPWFYLLIGGTCAYLAIRKHWADVSYLLISSLGGGLIDTIVKRFVDRPRPNVGRPCNFRTFSGEGWSFPSGHAMTSVIVYGALLTIVLPGLGRRWRIPATTLAILLPLAMGFSRLSLGVHWASDIVGGWLLGAAWLAISTLTFKRWEKNGTKGPAGPPIRQGN